MGTLSGATTNKIMTNTWLDSQISAKYTGGPCFTFTINWEISNGTITVRRLCTYKALDILTNDRIYYGIVDYQYVSGSQDSAYNPNSVYWLNITSLCEILNTISLPITQGNITINNIIHNAIFNVTKVLDVTGGLPIGGYSLSQIQNAISSQNATISCINPSSLASIEKYICKVSNAGVEFENNHMQYNGAPPSVRTGTFIDDEVNSSKRAITDKYFTKIFTGVEGDTNRCIRQDIDVFTKVVFYPIIGYVYSVYNGPNHSSNVIHVSGKDMNIYTSLKIVPPIFSGLDYFNYGNNSLTEPIYLSLNRGGGENNYYITVNSNSNNLNAVDVAWNYTSGKSKYTYKQYTLFKKYTIYDNDVYGATLGNSSNTHSCIKLVRNRKCYPGDIHGRLPYITPSILQDSTYKIYDIEYLSYSDAIQRYVHPTMNRSLTTSDGLSNNSSGKAIIPVIYIPSTIRFISGVGTCNVKLTQPVSGSYAKISISLSANRQFYVYKYAYGNRTSVANNNNLQRVKTSEIENISEFISQLNSGAEFSGVVNCIIYNSVGSRSYNKSFSIAPTFTYSTDSSGYLILTVNATAPQNEDVYDGQSQTSVSIVSSTVTMTATGVDGFLVGGVSSTERTTDTKTIIWSGGSSGSSSAMLTNTIGDFDYE